MDRGLYIAASGMLAEQIRQDLLANDLANVSTSGYKSDRASQRSFGDVLLSNTATGAIVGNLSYGASVTDIATDLTPGTLQDTGEPLDLAIEGDGFLAVQTDAGLRFVRGGRMVVDAEGRLATSAGQPLLDVNGQPVVVGGETGVTIAADGTVAVNGAAVSRLALVSLPDAQKLGESLFVGTPAAAPATSAVRQGYLEASGVDAARAMVDMLISLRTFEANQRVIRTIDDTLGRAVNSAGAVGSG
jgi:flagellar basal-body rod protein FlgG